MDEQKNNSNSFNNPDLFQLIQTLLSSQEYGEDNKNPLSVDTIDLDVDLQKQHQLSLNN